jgi:NAD-dependent deacetylase
MKTYNILIYNLFCVFQQTLTKSFRYMTEDLTYAAEIIKYASYCVGFTGAGISVESGIPPFRGENGLWNQYDPALLEISYFERYPDVSWKVIKEIFFDYLGKVEPNKAHQVMAKWEQKGIIRSIITQNIDNLHQEAGSVNVLEFHGGCRTFVCIECKSVHQSKDIDLQEKVPECNFCKGVLKPNFTFFGEGIPEPAGSMSFMEAKKADVLIIVGTTGEVMPASSIPFKAKENNTFVIEINPNSSSFTENVSDIFLQGKATEVFGKLDQLLV